MGYSSKNKVSGLILSAPDSKVYYVTVIRMGWQDGMGAKIKKYVNKAEEVPETGPCIRGQLIFDKNTKIIQWRKVFPTNGTGTAGCLCTSKQTNLDPYFTPYIKLKLYPRLTCET